ncbi:hypothetical protein F52700_6045 [Fusarium sp. NRRL 52700]|nr:hypothetical protein F52700_6045 [Fusarium sp. NRRL 52700]
MKFTSGAASTGTEAPSLFMISPLSPPYDLDQIPSLVLYSLMFFLSNHDIMVAEGKTSGTGGQRPELRVHFALPMTAARENVNQASLVPPAYMQQDHQQSNLGAPPSITIQLESMTQPPYQDTT